MRAEPRGRRQAAGAGAGAPMAAPAALDGPPTAGSSQVARALVAKVQDFAKQALVQQRPWQELLDRNAFVKPESLTEATTRIRKNAAYFRVNYVLVLLATVLLSMIWNPVSIACLIGLLALWSYMYIFRTGPLVISNRTINEREKFLALALFTVLVMVFTPVASIILSGLTIGLIAATAHAAFRVPDDLFLDDQDSGGFLSWLNAPQPVSSQLPASIGHV